MEQRNIQWHPAFAATIRIELEEELDKITIEEERLLSKKPMQMDVLIVKKNRDVILRKNIAQIFRTHNVIEYKSPKDYLSMNDYYKVLGYACFYQADTAKVGEIRPEEITITFVCKSYPRSMLLHLEERYAMVVEKHWDGIYYLAGGMFPTQIIVTKELSKKQNYWLQVLRDDLQSGYEIDHLMDAYEQKRHSKWHEEAIDTIIRANWEKVEEAKTMCEALRELFADELKEGWEKAKKEGFAVGCEEGRAEGHAKGRAEGRAEGEAIVKKVFKLTLQGKDIKEVANECEITEEKVREILE